MSAAMPRPIVEVLDDIVENCTDLLEQPHRIMTRGTVLTALAAEVEAWIRRPVEGVRLIDERTAWLIQATRAVCNTKGEERGQWRKLARDLLDHATTCFARSLEVRPSP
jgi:hypothetical protein